jgi:Uma2 family endonuclease
VNIWLKGDDKYNPEPDVTVIDAAIAIGQIYVVRFYFVAEVLSESDTKEVLEAKLAYYTGHEHNHCVLFVRQDRIGADQHDRGADGTWRGQHLDSPQAPLAFADIGPIGRLGDLYKFTPLDSFAST